MKSMHFISTRRYASCAPLQTCLRPGNSNFGLNINSSTGIGLKVPVPTGNINPAAGPIDYSLFGSSLNNSAASNFNLTPADPLVLDLNGDGVKLANYSDAPVLFDADNDGGSLEQTGWVSSADGIVVHDLNNDGKINNISETLSEYYNGVVGSAGVAGTKPYANGFAALKSLDSNNDNSFTAADAAWNNLRVWVDANHDGKTDAGELKTLANLGITALSKTQLLHNDRYWGVLIYDLRFLAVEAPNAAYWEQAA